MNRLRQAVSDRGTWAIVAVSLCMLPNLGHRQIEKWDESFHMIVAASAQQDPLALRLFPDHLYESSTHWTQVGIWLHKPPLSAWLGALSMYVFGRGPFAVRFVSWLSMLVTAFLLRDIARQMRGHRDAIANLTAPLLFLCLPFQFALVHGHQFGDVTDTLLTVFVTASHWALLRALRRKSVRWYIVMGMLTGLGVLTKSALALTPFAALAFAFLLPQNRRWRTVVGGLVALATTVLVAAPWDLYTKRRWPELYEAERQHLRDHLTGTIQFSRPWHAIFTENHIEQFAPLPAFLILAVGLTFVWRAARSRESALVTSAAHIATAWLVLSWANVKVPATSWSIAPLLMQALVTVFWVPARNRNFSRAQVVLPVAVLLFYFWKPELSEAKRIVFSGWLDVNRDRLQEGLLLCVGLMVAAKFAFREANGWMFRLVGGTTLAGLLGMVALRTVNAAQAFRPIQVYEYSARAGAFARRSLPANSMFFFPIEHELAHNFEDRSFMFWSGRLVVNRPADPDTARARGYKPYLVSNRAESFVPVYRRSDSPLWIYDLDQPSAAPSAPTDLRYVCADPTNRVLGVTPEPGAHGDLAQWVVYARAGEFPGGSLTFGDRHLGATTFHTQADSVPLSVLAAPWFSYLSLGPSPRRAAPVEVRIGSARCVLRANYSMRNSASPAPR